MNVTRAIAVVLLVLAGCRQPAKVEQPGARTKPEALKWDPPLITQMVLRVESNYASGLAFLNAHNYTSAYHFAIQQGRDVAAPYAKLFPSNAVKPGLMMEDWAKRLELPYRVACTRELDWCIEALATRATTVEKIRVLVNLHGDYPELKEKFEGLKPRIVK